jgi:polyhydroxyalkanoate synthesis regulator phasin
VQRLLVAYDEALTLPFPKNGAWVGHPSEEDSSKEDPPAEWTAAQSEVAALLQRLRGHLDYFGNAAGYTPLLSLQGTIQLYAEETKRALRTLLLVQWVDAKERDATEAANALGDIIVSLNEETQQAADQVTSSETKISEVTKRIEFLQQELNSLSNQLGTLRNQLLSKVENKAQEQARIKFAIKMAAAVCQVIPVGQPALGSIGSLAAWRPASSEVMKLQHPTPFPSWAV